jgi:hypothetical protein
MLVAICASYPEEVLKAELIAVERHMHEWFVSLASWDKEEWSTYVMYSENTISSEH